MFRSAYRLWERQYSHGGIRFIAFISMGTAISVLAFLLGIAYITGLLRAPSPTESYRPAGVGMCIAAIVSLSSFLLAVWWYARQYAGGEEDVHTPEGH